jgi:hypothetical protein
LKSRYQLAPLSANKKKLNSFFNKLPIVRIEEFGTRLLVWKKRSGRGRPRPDAGEEPRVSRGPGEHVATFRLISRKF